VTEEMGLQVLDTSKALKFLEKHPNLLKKDIIKKSELNALIKEGIVPDPQADGIDTSNTYSKVNFRKN
jgi:hypothetical protein